MKKLNEKISNPIIRGIVLIIFYIIIIILFLPSMPYAIVRGVCNLEYYEEWFEFIDKYKLFSKLVMTLQDYTTEELRAELKRRSDLAKSEKTKVKRCRMCKHWGEVDYWGKDLSGEQWEWLKRAGGTKPCKFFKTKNGKNYRCHAPSQLACEHFEPINND